MSERRQDPFHCEPPGTHARILQPWDGGLGVFEVEPPRVELLSRISVEGPLRFRLCESGCHALVLDREGKRVRVVALDGAGDPISLEIPGPRDVHIDDLLMVGGSVFAGGRLARVPMVWNCCLLALGDRLDDGEALRWVQLPMPTLEGPGGKSVDLLFWHHGDLIAVDDIVTPRWNIVFDVRCPHTPDHLATVLLPTHDSYEQVHVGAMGRRYLALYSSGMNYGRRSHHISILCAESQRERVCYSFREQGGADIQRFFRGGARDGAGDETSPLVDVRQLAFAGDVLFILSGRETLLVYDLRGEPLPLPGQSWIGFASLSAPEGPTPSHRQLDRVRTILHLTSVDERGVVVMGLDGEGRECVEWVGVEPR